MISARSVDTVTFTTDYGLVDPFVGVCHGVIARIAPAVRVLDVTHGVPPQDVLAGAVLLADCLPYLPRAVHLAVVDPGVGTARHGVAIAAGSPDERTLFVGPDNGLLVPAAERCGGLVGAWELTNPKYLLDPVSQTFHGRDIFAPVAAHLAQGVDPADLGPSLDVDSLVHAPLPADHVAEGLLRGTVVGVDQFGNVALSLRGTDLSEAGLSPGDPVLVVAGGAERPATVATTFGDVGRRKTALIVDSFGRLALIVNGGDAAGRVGILRGSGSQVEIRAVPESRVG